MKRFLTVAVAGVAMLMLSANAADSAKVNGWISDAMCGAKHAGTDMACAKQCLQGGQKPVFVDEAKKQVWVIDNPDAVKAFWGDHVTVGASADSGKMSMHINTIAETK
jgi:hypothetical protein